MKLLRSIWKFLADCMAAVAEDDYLHEPPRADDKSIIWQRFLGSTK